MIEGVHSGLQRSGAEVEAVLMSHGHAMLTGSAHMRPALEGVPMHFEHDIRLHVLSRLAGARLTLDGLDDLDTGSLLIAYFNAASRFVPARPRRVRRAREFDASLAQQSGNIQAAAQHIIGDIQAGASLTRYLSTGVENVHTSADQRNPTLRGRRDLDLMLNAWGVHHLHLSTAPGKGHYVKRTNELLFAVFRPTDAYLVDILPHGSFHKHHVLEVMARTWPNDGLMLKSLSGARLAHEFSEDDSKELREHGVSAIGIMIDDELWSPASVGITMGGTSVMLARTVQTLKWHLWWLGERLAENGRFLEEQFEGVVTFPREPSWTFYLNDKGYGVQELHTGATYILREVALPTIPLHD